MADVLSTALDLAARGLTVIPVPRPDATHGGKKPTIRWKQYQTRRPTIAELTGWFATPMNMAVLTGRISGIVVVDADSDAALAWVFRHLPLTPWQTKTPRGFHLWYRHPGTRIGNRVHIKTGDGELALDVRGDGGFVVAPGSVHKTGALYEQVGDWTVARDRLPVFWPGWLTHPSNPPQLHASNPPEPHPSNPPQPPRPPARTLRPTGDGVVDRAEKYLAAIPLPEIGAGSDVAVFKAACHLVRGFALDEVTAVDLLWEWAGGRPGWTREWIQTKVVSAIKNGREMVGGLLS